MRAYMAERRAKRRADLVAHLGGKCQHCGAIDDLEIDHVDPREKSFTLSGAALDRSWERLLAEAAKCQALCPRHHLEKTLAESPRSVGHGTSQMYVYRKCRCLPCKEAHSIARKRSPSRGGPGAQLLHSLVAQ